MSDEDHRAKLRAAGGLLTVSGLLWIGITTHWWVAVAVLFALCGNNLWLEGRDP